MEHLKSWLDREDLPSDYYRLLDKPFLSNHRDELLEAIRLANRFLHPYQNHRNEDARQRARTLQLLAAKAESTFSDEAAWQSYDSELLEGLREQYRQRLRTQTLSPTPHDARSWLIEQHSIVAERLEEVVRFVLIAQPSAVGPADSTPALTMTETSHSQRLPQSPAVPPTPKFLPGPPPFSLGSYEVLERLGEGGLGVVYKARHTQLRKLVAIKLLRPDRTADAKADVRFRREIQAIGQLQHPHIVAATDAGEIHGAHFLVMELLDGQDLHEVVRSRGPLPVYEACDLIRQAALGLQHAHEQGLIHRDIKPSNLMLTKQGVVKVLDLGLARLNPTTSAVEEIAANLEMGDATVTGAIVGTIDYMAPEQFTDRHHIDGRTDLYSLGCTLFFLLTGRAPFREAGSDLWQRLAAHGTQPIPSIRQIRSDSPPALDQLLQRLLAKLPQDRFSSAAEVAAALESFVSSKGSSPSIPTLVPQPDIGAVPPPTPTPTSQRSVQPPQPPRGKIPKPPSTGGSKTLPPPPPRSHPVAPPQQHFAANIPPQSASSVSESNPILAIFSQPDPTPPIVRSPKVPIRPQPKDPHAVVLKVAGVVLFVALTGIVWLLASGPRTDTKKSRQPDRPNVKSPKTSQTTDAP